MPLFSRSKDTTRDRDDFSGGPGTKNYSEKPDEERLAPDDPRKPDSPTDLDKKSWLGVAKRAFTEFKDDNVTDWAAALTYYAVLSIFPALIVFVSLLGVFGQGQSTVDALLGIVDDLGGPVDALEGPGHPGRAAAGQHRGPDADHRRARRAVDGVRLRRRLHPRLERDLRGRGGPEVLHPAAAADPGHHRRRAAADPDHAGDRVQRQRGAGDRRRDRRRRHRGHHLEHRQVAGHHRDRQPDDRRALPRRAQREAAEVPVVHPRRLPRPGALGARLGRLRLLRRELRLVQQDVRRRSARSSRSWSGCGSPTT